MSQFKLSDFFFLDPLEWTSSHIESWLTWCSRQFRINPRPQVKSFPTTGTELVALSRAEFQQRAGSHRAGRVLAVHLSHLRHAVTGRSPSPVSDEEDDEGKRCEVTESESDTSLTSWSVNQSRRQVK